MDTLRNKDYTTPKPQTELKNITQNEQPGFSLVHSFEMEKPGCFDCFDQPANTVNTRGSLTPADDGGTTRAAAAGDVTHAA